MRFLKRRLETDILRAVGIEKWEVESGEEETLMGGEETRMRKTESQVGEGGTFQTQSEKLEIG